MSQRLRHGRADEVGMDPARIERIRARARGWVEEGVTPSLVLLVARKGVIVFEEAYGILRPTDRQPLAIDSIFPVLSVSKPFTAAAVMCLVEDGRVSLKHPITDYFPQIVTAGADQVLIADLLAHTSGYEDVVVIPHVLRAMAAGASTPAVAPGQHPRTALILNHAADTSLARAPGEAMVYSNFVYLLLADLVRRVTGSSFASFAEERLFAPLAMCDTAFALPESLRARRVLRDASCPGHDDRLIIPAVDSVEADAWDHGAAGAASTARDVAAFGQMLLNGGEYAGRRVLSRASVRAMTTSQLARGTKSAFVALDPADGRRVEYPIRGGGYGFGLFMIAPDDRSAYFNGSLMGPRSYGHSGAWASCFWVDPDAELVGVYLSVQPRWRRIPGDMYWKADHFQDMVHAAIDA